MSHVGIYDLDDAMNHYDISSRYSNELGLSLARTFDTNVMRQIVLAARETVTSPFPSGQRISDADISTANSATLADTPGTQTHATAFWRALRAARVDLTQANVPPGTPIFCATTPVIFDSLKWVKDTGATGALIMANRDFGNPLSADTSKKPQTLMIEGITVMESNLIPQSDDSANVDVFSKYRADFTEVGGVMWIPDAVGTVRLINMGLESTRDTRRQEDFTVAKMAVGHGSLRNEGAIEITNQTTG